MIIKGAIVGLFLGSIFSLFYSFVSYWICLSISTCPNHWMPYVIVFFVSTISGFLLGGFFVILVKLLYKWTKV
jgi:hypothetical protein